MHKTIQLYCTVNSVDKRAYITEPRDTNKFGVGFGCFLIESYGQATKAFSLRFSALGNSGGSWILESTLGHSGTATHHPFRKLGNAISYVSP